MAAERSGRYLEATVTLTTCEDTTQSALYHADGTRDSGGRLKVANVLFTRVDGRLKAFDNDYLSEVTACPFD